jgi:hypothetical protein
MPLGTLKLKPGIDLEMTPTLNEAGFSSSQLIRFREGLPEKLGGWQKWFASPMGSVPRALHAWQDLQTTTHLAVGSESTLRVVTGASYADLSPQLTSSSIAVAFSTTIGSPTVTITDTGSNMTTYDSIVLQCPVAVGGLVLFGSYPVAAAIGANSYTITAPTNATATVASGGAVPSFATTSGSGGVIVTLAAHGLAVGDTVNFPVSTTGNGVTISGTYIVFQVNSSSTYTIIAATSASATSSFSMNSGNVKIDRWIAPGPVAGASGYGSGSYGGGGYGVGTPTPSHTGTPITSSIWSLDNFGSFLVAMPKDRPLFFWDPQGGFGAVRMIAQAPVLGKGMFVAMPQEQVIVYGASVDGQDYQDPMLVAWCDVGDFTVWTASVTNQAGTFRLPRGSEIISGLQTVQQGLLWTDLGLWAMQYIGSDLVYGFNSIGEGCGIIAQRARASQGGAVYWMSQSQFFRYGGSGIEPLECSVWDLIFQDLDTANKTKIHCAANAMFNEVSWYFPSLSGGTGEVDKYVKLNTTTGAWDYGSLVRTAWIDQGVLGQPIGAGSDGYLYQHEVARNADGSAMTSSFTTGYFMLMEGDQMAFVNWLWPDFKWGVQGGSSNASLAVTFYVVDFPGDTPKTFGPYTVTQASRQISDVRFRGRQVQIKVESSDLDSFWRMGLVRFQYAPDGKSN